MVLSTEGNKKEDKAAFKEFSMNEQLETVFQPYGFAGLRIREKLIWAQKANQQRV